MGFFGIRPPAPAMPTAPQMTVGSSWFDSQPQPAVSTTQPVPGVKAGGQDGGVMQNAINAGMQAPIPGQATTLAGLTQGSGMLDGGDTSLTGILSPWDKQFQPRDPSQIANDPAYKFQTDQGLQGIQRSAAAKGTLLTGGTLKALDAYGQGLASTYDDKFYNRDINEYLLGRDNFFQNQDRPFTKLSGLAQLGKPSTAV